MLRSCYLKLMNVILVVFLLISTVDTSRANSLKVILSAEEVSRLIPEIEAAEKRLLNIRIDSEAWMEEATSPSGPWERTRVHVTATSWFNGLPKNKSRVDIHSEILRVRYEDLDNYSYIEQNYTASYDGEFGRIIYHKYGNVGNPSYVKRGTVLSKAPSIFNGRRTGVVTGLRFTTNYFFADRTDIESFSQYFKIAISPKALELDSFEFVREEYDGIDCIRFSFKGSKSVRMSWWFDPSRGFALLEYKKIRKNEEGVEFTAERIKVNKLKKVLDDIWWPVEGTVESYKHKQGESYTRTVYRASNVVANDSNFDESIFYVSFPGGYLIDDKVTGRKYRVGEYPNTPKD